MSAVTPRALSEDLGDGLQAKTLIDTQKDVELSDVASLVIHNMPAVFSTKDDDQIEGEALDSETLIIEMKLDDWRCGGCKPSGEPCQRLISKKRQVMIRSQLNQMLTLSQSSGNLDNELKELIMLVHCQSHDHGYAKEDRLELWTKAFPQGSVNPTVSIGKQIRRALHRVEQRCIGMNQKQERCRRNVGGQRVQNCCTTIDKILQPDIYEDAELLEGYLRVLESNMYCPSHVDKQGYKRVSIWKSSIIDILEKPKSGLVRDTDILTTPTEDETEATNREPVSQNLYVAEATFWPNKQLPTPRNTRSLSPEFYHSPSKFWPSTLDTGPFRRLPRLDGVPTPAECYGLVKNIATRNLAKVHNTEGYIYLYEVEGNEGCVKIGYTKALDKRHKEWSFDCNRKTKLLYPLSEHGLEKVPNAPRVEALCHSELDYCRIRVDCGACLKEHVEWFEITPKTGIQVIKKWSQWIRKEPYGNVMTDKGMLLKKEEHRKTKDMVKL